ncbi:murein hydrolase activator EnvC family protein [Biformimicrobium ophioploci]|uniref:murein hydrolase activator EnvC family protein n=1 Tax=Biformimicrobium ophioploci TaxID=3036711 RepID=UPI002555488E|nr:peptidoglycan DD-metalloendopeptidase family protein [Microbulbifer sp. NKW57]
MIFPLLLASLLLGTPAMADDQKRLEAVQKNIALLKKELSEVKTERQKLLAALERNEVDIGTLSERVDKIKKDLKTRQDKLKKLHQEKKTLETGQRSMQGQVEREIATAYQMGRQEQLKLLLNQQDPQQVARLLRYHDYLLSARSQTLTAYSENLESLERVRLDIEAETSALRRERDQLASRQQDLRARQQDRRQTLDALAKKLGSRSEQLQRLQADRQRLQKILDSVSDALASLVSPQDGASFKSRRGKMAWPVKGRRGNAFGSRRDSGLDWQGINIRASEGTAVRAIHRGRVVFSDYLRNLGLLIILDHGDGYMSLYGHNQALSRELGDWVEAGDTIARVGNSGGHDRHGVYFEIRRHGKPVDPMSWCRG